MYKVLNGFNTLLKKGERWDMSNGGRVVFGSDSEEVRFDIGDTISALPSAADETFLLEIGAIEKVDDKDSASTDSDVPKKRKVKNG